MTFAAEISLDESGAHALADAISFDPALADRPLDLAETAAGRWQIVVYFEAEPLASERLALERALRTAFGQSSSGFTIRPLPAADWVRRSLAVLKPIRAGRFLVHGRHDRDRIRANDIAIEIEANEAFGTGHHGSTLGCLLAIDRLAKARSVRRALDLGTGSGILAIAIARSLKARVLASDIDATAAHIAAANAHLNGVRRSITAVTADGLGHRIFRLHGPFDLIVANILAGPLARLAPSVRRHLAAGGVTILSGLLPGQKARVVSAYRGQGLRLVHEFTCDGWLTLVLDRKPVKTAETRDRPLRAPLVLGQRSRARRRQAR
jgi:ribosomal protein L11 methyltransferase